MRATASARPVIASVPVVDRIPGVAESLPADELAVARDTLRADVVALDRGEHELEMLCPAGFAGLLVLDGWVIRNVTLGGRTAGVLAGPGTLLRARRDGGADAAIPYRVHWRVVQPTRLAVLGPEVLAATARWPQITVGLLGLAFDRVHLGSLVGTIRGLVHLELRLLGLMWIYAEMFGHPVGEGMVLPVRLSHGDLAELVAGRRPPVSAHLARLAAQGLVRRRPDRTWLLMGDPPAELEDLRVRERTSAVAGGDGGLDFPLPPGNRG
jgi:CRP/FNR family transcriptional regulator, cyclic AMP receptor protein